MSDLGDSQYAIYGVGRLSLNGPDFGFPIFINSRNEYFTAQIGDGTLSTIISFSSLTIDDLPVECIDRNLHSAAYEIGDLAVYSFFIRPGLCIVGDRAIVCEFIKGNIREICKPFLLIRMARFFLDVDAKYSYSLLRISAFIGHAVHTDIASRHRDLLDSALKDMLKNKPAAIKRFTALTKNDEIINDSYWCFPDDVKLGILLSTIYQSWQSPSCDATDWSDEQLSEVAYLCAIAFNDIKIKLDPPREDIASLILHISPFRKYREIDRCVNILTGSGLAFSDGDNGDLVFSWDGDRVISPFITEGFTLKKSEIRLAAETIWRLLVNDVSNDLFFSPYNNNFKLDDNTCLSYIKFVDHVNRPMSSHKEGD